MDVDEGYPASGYLSPNGGLQVKFPAITLGPVKVDLGDKFIASAGDKSKHRYKVWKPEDEDQWPLSWDKTLSYIVISHDGYRDIRDRGFGDVNNSFEECVEAILGVLNGDDELDRPRVRHVYRALIWPGLRQWKEESKLQDDQETALPEVKDCRWCKPQKWCIA